MGKLVLKNQKIWFDGFDLSGRINNVSLEHGADAQEATTFGDNTRGYKPGLKTVSAGASGFVDLDGLDAALFSNIAVGDKAFSFADSTAEGGTIRFFKAMAGSYKAGGAVGEMFKFDLGAAAQGSLVRGTLMENNTGITANGNGTARELVAVPAGKKLVACIHVLAVAGTNPTLDAVIKSDATNAFSGDEVQRLAFAQKTDKGSEVIELDGPLTDTWHKVYWTIGGTDTPTFDFIIGLGITN